MESLGKRLPGVVQALKGKHRFQTSIVAALPRSQRKQVYVEPLQTAIKNVLSSLKYDKDKIRDQLLGPLDLPFNSPNRLNRPSLGWKSMVQHTFINGQPMITIFHSSNLRVTTVGLNLLSYTWGEAITMRTVHCVGIYARANDKSVFSCLPTRKSTDLKILRSPEGKQIIWHLDECLTLAKEERKIAWTQRSRLLQPMQLIKQVCASLQGGVRRFLQFFSKDKSLLEPQVAATNSISTILQTNARRRHGVDKCDSPEAELFNKITRQMSEKQHPGQGIELCKGKDGFYSPFTGADNADWCVAKAMKICKERLYRSIFTCNKGQLRDENWSWKTHYFIATWDCLSTWGVDPFSGLPLTWEARLPHRGSFGHIIHGEPMFCGFTTPDPTDISDFQPRRKNIGWESWLFNAFKSNSPSHHVREALIRLVSWSATPDDLASVGVDSKAIETGDELAQSSGSKIALERWSSSIEEVKPQLCEAPGASVSAKLQGNQEVVPLDNVEVVRTFELFRRAWIGNANDEIDLEHQQHRLYKRQLGELDPDGHVDWQEMFLGDDTLDSYLKLIERDRGGSVRSIYPSHVEDWTVPGFATNLLGEDMDHETRYILAALHFGRRQEGHWVAGFVDREAQLLEVYDSGIDVDNISESRIKNMQNVTSSMRKSYRRYKSAPGGPEPSSYPAITASSLRDPRRASSDIKTTGQRQLFT